MVFDAFQTPWFISTMTWCVICTRSVAIISVNNTVNKLSTKMETSKHTQAYTCTCTHTHTHTQMHKCMQACMDTGNKNIWNKVTYEIPKNIWLATLSGFSNGWHLRWDRNPSEKQDSTIRPCDCFFNSAGLLAIFRYFCFFLYATSFLRKDIFSRQLPAY